MRPYHVVCYILFAALHIKFLGNGKLLEAPDVWGRVARDPIQ